MIRITIFITILCSISSAVRYKHVLNLTTYNNTLRRFICEEYNSNNKTREVLIKSSYITATTALAHSCMDQEFYAKHKIPVNYKLSKEFLFLKDAIIDTVIYTGKELGNTPKKIEICFIYDYQKLNTYKSRIKTTILKIVEQEKNVPVNAMFSGGKGLKRPSIKTETTPVDPQKRVVQLNKKIAKTHNAYDYQERGRVYFILKKYTEAIKDFNKALTLSPKMQEIHIDIALCHDGLGNSEKAVSHFKKAFKSPRTNPKHYETFAGFLYKKKLKDHYKSILPNLQTINGDYWKGCLKSEMNDPHGAISNLNKYIRLTRIPSTTDSLQVKHAKELVVKLGGKPDRSPLLDGYDSGW